MASMNAQMKNTMEEMLKNSGYHVKVSITKAGYKGVINAIGDRGTMTLEYPDTLTPGEVVFAIRNLLNKLNGK